VIERLHEEFRRRVRTQGSLPSEEAAVVLLFGLVATGKIKLRRIDGWGKIAAVLSQPMWWIVVQPFRTWRTTPRAAVSWGRRVA
jgi:hypothetical protein